MKKSTFTLILFFSSVILYAQQNELMFHSLGSQHGLTYSAVRDILQDSKGYIWIATLKGLNRYDGYNIKQYYKSDDGLSSNCIEKLLLLGQDTLLMGTNEGLCLYDMMREVHHYCSANQGPTICIGHGLRRTFSFHCVRFRAICI